jgi:hypothetical protein
MPQSTGAPEGEMGPFSRHSRRAKLKGFAYLGKNFGDSISDTIKPVGGYLRHLDVHLAATGGSGSVTAIGTADAPYNAVQSLLLKDPYGEPIIQGSGYSTLKLIPQYSGQFGSWEGNDPENAPSFSAIAGDGIFNLRTMLPIENLSDGYCSLPLLNASAQPLLQVTLAASSAVYATPPQGLPTVDFEIEEGYWAAPVDYPEMAPPDNGSSKQWSEATAATSIGSGASVTVQLPRKGTWIDTIILVLRDADGVRIDAFPEQIEFWIDGAPLYIEPFEVREDLMWRQFGVTRPTGVCVYSFRDDPGYIVGEHDTADLWLPTTPGSLLEVRGTWGTISAGPAQLTVITGEVYPFGGIPYGHLAE